MRTVWKLMKLPDKKALDIMWAVATSTSIETGTRPHHIFAKLLYNDFTNTKPIVGLCDDFERKESTTQKT